MEPISLQMKHHFDDKYKQVLKFYTFLYNKIDFVHGSRPSLSLIKSAKNGNDLGDLDFDLEVIRVC